jgi:release factor glutamine methyltransferase
MRLRDWLEQGEAQLRLGPHPDRARRDAETLLLYLIGKPRAWLVSHLDEPFAGGGPIGYAGLIERREKGEPIQYITGETEFYGLPFLVTRHVLIPRPETEHLVEKILELGRDLPVQRIVDVGTGSGAVAVALAREMPDAQITAIDLSKDSLDVARRNAEANGVGDRVRFLEGDLLQPVQGSQFDIIASNPPYIPAGERDSLAVEVRQYEPALALFAGEDGLAAYRRLIPQSRGALVRGGIIALEIGYGQAQAAEQLLAENGFAAIAFTEDLQGIRRVATARLS